MSRVADRVGAPRERHAPLDELIHATRFDACAMANLAQDGSLPSGLGREANHERADGGCDQPDNRGNRHLGQQRSSTHQDYPADPRGVSCRQPERPDITDGTPDDVGPINAQTIEDADQQVADDGLVLMLGVVKRRTQPPSGSIEDQTPEVLNSLTKGAQRGPPAAEP
jgi:hypothetical protein